MPVSLAFSGVYDNSGWIFLAFFWDTKKLNVFRYFLYYKLGDRT